MRKIKAFTLFELLITISISSLLVAFAFKAFVNFQQISLIAGFQIDQKEERDAFLFAMENDVFKSQFIYKWGEKLVFLNGNDSLIYGFNQNTFLRRGKLTDSFELKDMDLHYQFQNEYLINAVELQLNSPIDTLRYSYKKSYSSEDLLNWERRQNEN